MFDKSLCHLGNVHQTVLMYTDIYKCTEIFADGENRVRIVETY